MDSRDTDNHSSLSFNERDGCRNLRSRFNPLINNEYTLPWCQNISADLQLLAVARVITEFDSICFNRELSPFANSQNANIQFLSDRCAKNEPIKPGECRYIGAFSQATRGLTASCPRQMHATKSIGVSAIQETRSSTSSLNSAGWANRGVTSLRFPVVFVSIQERYLFMDFCRLQSCIKQRSGSTRLTSLIGL